MQERRQSLGVDMLLSEKFFEPPTKLDFEFKEGDFPLPPNDKDKLASFFQSQEGIDFKKKLTEITAKLLAFAQAHQIPGAQEAINQFKGNFVDYTGRNVLYNAKVLPLYIAGVPSLAGIIKFIEHVNNDPNQCKDVLRNLMQEILVCGPGVYTNLASAYMQLVAKRDRPNYFKTCREKLIRQFVVEMVPKNEEQLRKLLGDEETNKLIQHFQNDLRVPFSVHIAGNEIHYVNAICNRYADALAINAYEDDFVQHCEGIILDKCMRRFEREISKYLSPELIVNYLIDNSEIQVKIDELLAAGPDKYETLMEEITTALKFIGGREFASEEISTLLVRDPVTGKYTSRSSQCDALLAFYATQEVTKSGYIENNYTAQPLITNDRLYTLPGKHSLSLGYVQVDCDVMLLSTFDPAKIAEIVLPGKARTAYIVTTDNKLYYVDKLNKTGFLLAGVYDGDLMKITESMSEATKNTTQVMNENLSKVQLQLLCKKLKAMKQALSPEDKSLEAVDIDAMKDRTELLTFLSNIRGEIIKLFNGKQFILLTEDQKENIDGSQDMLKSKLLAGKQPLINYLVDLYLYHPEQYKLVMADRQLNEREHEVSEGVALFLKNGTAKAVLAAMQKRSLDDVLTFASKCNKNHLKTMPLMLSIIHRFNPADFNALYNKPPAKISDLIHKVITPAGLSPELRIFYLSKLLEFYLEQWAMERANNGSQGNQLVLAYAKFNGLSHDFNGLTPTYLISLLTERGGLPAEKILRYFDNVNNYIGILRACAGTEQQLNIIKANLALDDESIKILFNSREIFAYITDLLRQKPNSLDESELVKLAIQEMMLRLKEKSITTAQDFLDSIKRYPVSIDMQIKIANQLREIDDGLFKQILETIKINNKDELRKYFEANVGGMELAINLLPENTITPIVQNEEILLQIIRDTEKNKRCVVLMGIIRSLNPDHLRIHILSNPDFLLRFLNEVPHEDIRELVQKFMVIPGIKPYIHLLTATHVHAILGKLQNDEARLEFLKSIDYAFPSMIDDNAKLNKLLLAFDDKKYVIEIFKLCQANFIKILKTRNTVEGGGPFPVAVLANYFKQNNSLQNSDFLNNRELSELPGDAKFIIKNLNELDSIIKKLPQGTKPHDVLRFINIGAFNKDFLHPILAGKRNAFNLQQSLNEFIQSSPANSELFNYLILGMLKDYINELRPLGMLNRPPGDTYKAATEFHNALLHNITPQPLVAHLKGTHLSDLYSLYLYFKENQNILKRTDQPQEYYVGFNMIVMSAQSVDKTSIVNLNGGGYVLNDVKHIRCSVKAYDFEDRLDNDYTSLQQHPCFGMDGGVIVFDATKAGSFEIAKTLYERYKSPSTHFILVGINGDSANRIVSTEDVKSFVRNSNMTYFPTAANDQETMKESFMRLVQKIALDKFPRHDKFKSNKKLDELQFLHRFKPDEPSAEPGLNLSSRQLK